MELNDQLNIEPLNIALWMIRYKIAILLKFCSLKHLRQLVFRMGKNWPEVGQVKSKECDPTPHHGIYGDIMNIIYIYIYMNIHIYIYDIP